MKKDVAKALTGIEIALREMNSLDKKPDEFTVRDFIADAEAQGRTMTYDSADKHLRRMEEKKLLKSRVTTTNSRLTRAYSAY
jgi:hypothetical protein